MNKKVKVLTVRNGKLTHVNTKASCSVQWAKNYIKSASAVKNNDLLHNVSKTK